jgi:predicted membrane protein
MTMTTLRATESRAGAGQRMQPKPHLLYNTVASLLSLLAASGLSLLIILYPQAVMPGGVAPDHTALMLCMYGIAGGFVHGVGFVPRNPLLRFALGPLVAWPLMLVGTLLMLAGSA